MLKSMTGFGKEAFIKDGKTVVVEIRALNSKQTDIITRITSFFREYEREIRSMLTQELMRGKIDVTISIEGGDTATAQINRELVKNYYETLKELSMELSNPFASDLFIQSLKMPDVVSVPNVASDDRMKTNLLNAVKSACDKVNEFRSSEGEYLAADLKNRIVTIQNLIHEIIPFEENRIKQLREKIVTAFSTLSSEINYNKNRFEEEMIYYLEKIDITEEKVRLNKHCLYFLEIMNEEQNGKKLSFIAQEIGREINTIGSKANDFKIQQIVVNMKDELEKIKEQLNNIL